MIHSCAGGVVRDKKYLDFAKVEILSSGEIKWYISNIPLLQAGDVVIVCVGRDSSEERAKVLQIDKNVSDQVAPVPVKHAREILRICE